jgi:hypothetical protein
MSKHRNLKIACGTPVCMEADCISATLKGNGDKTGRRYRLLFGRKEGNGKMGNYGRTSRPSIL